MITTQRTEHLNMIIIVPILMIIDDHNAGNVTFDQYYYDHDPGDNRWSKLRECNTRASQRRELRQPTENLAGHPQLRFFIHDDFIAVIIKCIAIIIVLQNKKQSRLHHNYTPHSSITFIITSGCFWSTNHHQRVLFTKSSPPTGCFWPKIITKVCFRLIITANRVLLTQKLEVFDTSVVCTVEHPLRLPRWILWWWWLWWWFWWILW